MPCATCSTRPPTSSRSSAGCGTAGRTTPTSTTSPPAGSSTATSCTTSTSTAALHRQGPVDHAPPAAGPADRLRACPQPGRSSSPPRRPTSCSSRPTTRPTSPADRRGPGAEAAVGRRRAGAAGVRRPRRVPRDTRRRRGPPGRARRPGRLLPPTPPSSSARRGPGRPAAVLAGPRLRRVPAATGRDRPTCGDRRGRRPGPPGRGAFRTGYDRDRCASASACPVPQPLRQERMTMPNKPRKQIILGAHFPGVNNTTVWSDPAADSQVAFDSFRHFAQTAERGKFDFFFLAEGLRLREQRGRIHDLDVVGRPDTLTILAALAGVTTHLGLAGTLNATYNEAYELARKLATLDHLSGGRAAGTSSRRRTRSPARTSAAAATSTTPTATCGPASSSARPGSCGTPGPRTRSSPTVGRAVRPLGTAGGFEHRGEQFDIRGNFTVPRSPQRHPVILQAGDSDGGRELAAATSDAIFSRHSARRRPGVLRRHQVPPGQLRAVDRRAEDHPGHHVRARRLAPRTRPRRPTPSAASRSVRRRRSCCWSSCGTVTCRPTTPRVRCRTSTPTCRRRRSSRAGPGSSPTR